MPLKSLKNKITSLAEGEVLGDAAANPEDFDQSFIDFEFNYEPQKKKNNKKEKQIPKEVSKKELPEKKIKKPKQISIPENKQKEAKQIYENNKSDLVIDTNLRTGQKAISTQMQSDDLIDGYKDILNMLGIKLTLDLNTEFSSEDLDYVEFTQTQPLGFDFDEVTDFISRVKYNLYKQEAALRQRDLDVKRLASEVKKVEERMIEQNQAKELERMIGGMTEEERLIEENMDLKVQVNELTRRLETQNKHATEQLRREIEALKAENDILKMSTKSSTLPIVENNKEIEDIDMFASMLDDIGGLYNDE